MPTSPAPTVSQRRAAAVASGARRQAGRPGPRQRGGARLGHRDLQALLGQQRHAFERQGTRRVGQQLRHQQVDRQQLDQQRRVAEDLDVDRPEPGHQRVVRQPHQPDRQPQRAGQHDAEQRHAQRVGHADREGAQVAVARMELEQQLADVEAGRVVQEAEARPDLARLEIGGDVARQADADQRQHQHQRALQQPLALAPRALSCAPGRVSGGGRGHGVAVVGSRCLSEPAASTSGRPWSTGCWRRAGGPLPTSDRGCARSSRRSCRPA